MLFYGISLIMKEKSNASALHEHVANIANALAHDFVGLLAVFGRHNIRPPHFASKVSYSASPQTLAKPYLSESTHNFRVFKIEY